MRRVGRHNWECSACAAQFRVAPEKLPVVMVITRQGRPRERVILVDGSIVHRCELP